MSIKQNTQTISGFSKSGMKQKTQAKGRSFDNPPDNSPIDSPSLNEDCQIFNPKNMIRIGRRKL